MSAFDPLRLLRALLENDVECIVIGGFAGRVWGSPTITNDLDLCYARDKANCDRLAKVLLRLHATLRGAPPNLPLQLDGDMIRRGDSFTFDTDAGALDCLGTPAGTRGFTDLAASAISIDLENGLDVRFCSLDDLIRMKRASSRPKDLIEIEVLEAVRQEREKK